jgi:hypothetical protein
MIGDVAGAEVRGFVVVGRADDGLGRWVDGFALADTLVVGGGLGVGSGARVGEGAAVDGGTTSVGALVWSDPPRKCETTRAPPPQQSTSRPSTGNSRTTIRRRSAGCAGTSVAGCSHGISGSVGVVTDTPCDQNATLVEGCGP